jgi:hypothetical protein
MQMLSMINPCAEAPKKLLKSGSNANRDVEK